MKRILILTDPHCGHKVGLTPPDWDSRPGEGYGTRAYSLYQHRRECWRTFAKWCEDLQPVYGLIVNGDVVDGKGPRSGGTELLTADRLEQCAMAEACIKEARAERIVMSYGTPYHTGQLEDWEDEVARLVNAEKIGGHDFLNVDGVVIDYKHHIGASSIPHGRFTAIARERLWNGLWAERKEYPQAHILVRSHVHYYVYAATADWAAIVTPALQGYGSKYGVRRCSGTVDFGLVYIDIEKGGEAWAIHPLLKRFTRLASITEW